MTETPNHAPKRGIPIWIQIVIWGSLVVLLVIISMGLRRAQEGTAQPGDKISNFTLPLYSGYEYKGQNSVSLSDLRGKVVVINFWASWCKPCEQEAADLQSTWESYAAGDQVIFLGADYVDTEPEARIYLQKFGISYANGPDMGTRISQMFRIRGVPETYFIDRDGVLRFVKIGPFSSADELKAQIEQLLQ